MKHIGRYLLGCILLISSTFVTLHAALPENAQTRIDSFLESIITETQISSLEEKVLSINLSEYNYSNETVVFLEDVFNYVLQSLEQKRVKIEDDLKSQQQEQEQQEEENTLNSQTESQKDIENQRDISEFYGDSYTIVGGESARVYTADVSANLEKIDVGEVNFILRSNEDTSDVRQSIKNASLYYGNTFIDTNSNGDIESLSGNRFSIDFPNIDTLVVGLDEEELHLVLHTQEIGFQRVGTPLSDFFVESLRFSDSTGVTSGNDSPSFTLREDGDTFSIVIGNIVPSVKRSIDFGLRAELELFLDVGNNVVASSNAQPQAVLDTLIFDIRGSNFGDNVPVFSLENTDNGQGVVGIISGNTLTFDASTLPASARTISGNTSEDFEIVLSGIDSFATIFLDLESRGIEYRIDGQQESISLFRDLSLGNYSAR